jgi:hypothetical protein
VPPGTFDRVASQTTDFEGGTSHISIVDQYGNALSMTTSIEWYFGSGLMVRGFLLNNQLTDFSFAATDGAGTPIANRVQSKKRPRSSMSPTIVLNEDGKPAYLTGSPGGYRIIGYTAQSLLSMLDFGYDPQQAANTPFYQNRNGDTEIEVPQDGITSDYDVEALNTALEARGHEVVQYSGDGSGLGIIQVTADGFLGGADPRRAGTAAGRLDTDAPVAAGQWYAVLGNDDGIIPAFEPQLNYLMEICSNTPFAFFFSPSKLGEAQSYHSARMKLKKKQAGEEDEVKTSRCEKIEPYALFGNTQADFNLKTMAPGLYQASATLNLDEDCEGDCLARHFEFEIVDCPDPTGLRRRQLRGE